MGCDVHVYIERRINKGPWHIDPGHTIEDEQDIGDGSTRKILNKVISIGGRNYAMFGLIAGVRGGDALIDPRGLPKDLSAEVVSEAERWGSDCHTHTWLTPKELKKCFKEYERLAKLDGEDASHVWQGDAKTAFSAYGINDAILKYIELSSLDDQIVGTKTEFRLIIWFDS